MGFEDTFRLRAEWGLLPFEGRKTIWYTVDSAFWDEQDYYERQRRILAAEHEQRKRIGRRGKPRPSEQAFREALSMLA